MIAPGEGSASKITGPADNAEPRNGANGGISPRIVGEPEPWQVRTLLLLQHRVREAQQDFASALASFAPEGCSLEGGKWVRKD